MALPATIGKSYPQNPFPCGAVKTVTAGTAVQVSHNFTDLATRRASRVIIRGIDNNTGVCYIIAEPGSPPWTLPGGGSTSGADTTNYLNVIQFVEPGETITIDTPSGQYNMIRIGELWIDSANSGEGVIVTVYEA